MLRYRVTLADGRRVEHNAPVGLLAVLPKESDAWREVDRFGLSVRINDSPGPGRLSFHSLAEHYLKADFGAQAVRYSLLSAALTSTLGALLFIWAARSIRADIQRAS